MINTHFYYVFYENKKSKKQINIPLWDPKYKTNLGQTVNWTNSRSSKLQASGVKISW